MKNINIAKIKKQIPFYEKLVKTLKTLNTDVRLVGGSVRNLLLDVSVNDWDFVVTERALELGKELSKITNSAFVLLDEELEIARLVPRNNRKIYLDFAISRGNLKKDLILRDFTINAIAIDMKTGEIIDPSGGIKDLENRLIRASKKRNISDDPLRILRAYRMKAQFGFNIDTNTLKWMKEYKDMLKEVSFERIRDEIFKILSTPHSAKIMEEMYDAGILPVIIPELVPMDGMQQNSFHKFDVLRHSFVTYDEMEKLISLNPSPLPYGEKIKDYLSAAAGGDRSVLQLLKFATLLHDVGKPLSQQVNHLGHLYYRGHPIEGRILWLDIARRFKLSNHEIDLGGKFIEYHLGPIIVVKHDEGRPRQEKLYEFYRNSEKSFPGVILLSWGDVEAGQGKSITQEIIDIHHDHCRKMLEQYFTGDRLASPPKYMTGKEIMQVLNIPQGKEVGKIYMALEKAIALGDVNSREEAEEFCRNWKMEVGNEAIEKVGSDPSTSSE